MNLSAEWIGLLVVILTQIIVIVSIFQSLRERVKVLEQKVEKTLDNHDTLVEIGTKLDLLYEIFITKK
jgi:hypothetical protein